MGVRIATAFSNSLLTATVVTTAETAIITTPPINLTQDGALVLISYELMLTIGTGGTQFNTIIRRGSGLAGPVVTTATFLPATAGTNGRWTGLWQDNPGLVAEFQWTMTVSVTAATGNSTILEAAMVCAVL